MHPKRFLLVTVILSIVAFWAAAVPASAQGNIGFNTVEVAGTIYQFGQVNDYHIYALGGTLLEVSTVDANCDIDPWVMLFGPDGSLLAEDDDSGASCPTGIRFNSLFQIPLPSTGWYTIRVTTWNANGGYEELVSQGFGNIYLQQAAPFETGNYTLRISGYFIMGETGYEEAMGSYRLYDNLRNFVLFRTAAGNIDLYTLANGQGVLIGRVPISELDGSQPTGEPAFREWTYGNLVWRLYHLGDGTYQINLYEYGQLTDEAIFTP